MSESKPRVAIVADSTCDLPADLVQANGIHVVPLNLIMGDKTWRDGVDIDPPTFYKLLETSPDFPSTSQPNVAAFQSLFTELAQDFDGIAAVMISSDLSGTYESAQLAAENLPDVPIEVIDTRAVTASLGLIVLAAARAAAEGQDLASVAGVVRGLIDKVRIYFVVDTLEYLHRGGRIGSAAKLLGSVLNMKPILAIEKGVVVPLSRVRTKKKALATVEEMVQEHVSPDSRVHLNVFHVAAPDAAVAFGETLQGQLHPVEMVHSECGPVIGTHVGPGTVGVAFYVE